MAWMRRAIQAACRWAALIDSVGPLKKQMIKRKTGLFEADLLTAGDIQQAVRAEFFSPGASRPPTGQRIVSLGKENGLMVSTRSLERRVWILRDFDRYEKMGPAEIGREYERQLKKVKGESPIGVVS